MKDIVDQKRKTEGILLFWAFLLVIIGGCLGSAVRLSLGTFTPTSLLKLGGGLIGLLLFFGTAHGVIRKKFPQADPFFLPLMLVLTSIGIFLQVSLGTERRFFDQATGALLGGVTLILAFSAPLREKPLHRYTYLYVMVSVGLLLLLALMGRATGGVKLTVFGFQPVEIIKILMVFFLAAYLSENGEILATKRQMLPAKKDILPFLVLYCLPLGLFAVVKDFGPALILFGTFLGMIYLVSYRGIYVVLGASILFCAGWLAYATNFGVFGTRVSMWLDPWNNDRLMGDQLARGLWGLASGGPLGSGMGLGGARFIPRGGDDMALTAVGEEMGLPVTLLILVCLLTLVGRGLIIARGIRRPFDRYLLTGLSLLLGIQTLVSVCGNLGLLPLSGITLPLVSYGRSSLVSSFFQLGMMLSLTARAEPSMFIIKSESSEGGFVRATHRSLLFFIISLGLIPMIRLVYTQAIGADKIAGYDLYTKDKDKIKRPHDNPRYALMAAKIKMGRILDRNGEVIASGGLNTRNYPTKKLLGTRVGYLNEAIGGPQGWEKEYRLSLHGFSDMGQFIRLWRMKDLPGFHLPESTDVTMAIDMRLQRVAAEALGERSGAVVLVDVATGGIRAAATYPNYDPNTLTPATLAILRKRTDAPMLDRARWGRYAPGSTFKIVTATTMLNNHLEDFTTNCTHQASLTWQYGGENYARRLSDDQGEQPHNTIGFTDAIAQSCNLYFARSGVKLGPEALRLGVEKFRFSSIPSPDEFAVGLAEIPFGQGAMRVTPQEMATVALTVASGGKLIRLQDQKTDAPQVLDTLLTPEQAKRLTQAMQQVTTKGTAKGRFDDLPFPVAGKTGTAQDAPRKPHSWFIGFAPADHPQYAIAVIIENAGYGAKYAVPVAHKVFKEAVK